MKLNNHFKGKKNILDYEMITKDRVVPPSGSTYVLTSTASIGVRRRF